MEKNISLISLLISSSIFGFLLYIITLSLNYDWNEYYKNLVVSGTFLFLVAYLYNKIHELNATKSQAIYSTFLTWFSISIFLMAVGVLTKTNINISRLSFFSTITAGFILDSLFIYFLYMLSRKFLTKSSIVIFANKPLEPASLKVLSNHFQVTSNKSTSDFLKINDHEDGSHYLIVDDLTQSNLEKYQKKSLSLANRVLFMPSEVLGLKKIKKNFYGQFVLYLNDSKLNNSYFGRTSKRVFDIFLSLIALIITMPLLLTIAIIIKLTSDGPIIYSQKRNGINGKIFNMYKFRSMKIHDESFYVQTKVGDSRITSIGKVIRKLSIDELPQIFNVIKGDMSIVGPRPHALEINKKYKNQIVNFMSRHKIKPGITGLAQINGYRGGDNLKSMEKRTEYDLNYINSWSLILDLKIILLTIPALFRENIY
tara:strand:+ start:2380 stop:3657 length:1278 start_codon:yes stop_codon:yes gene_type:complete